MKKPIFQSDIKEYPLFRRGKVRDVYDMNDKLLIVASDRISAFDVVMPRAIPEKGIILNQMSLFWFNFIKDIVKNHLLVTKFEEFPENLRKYKAMLKDRAVIVRKAERFDIECVVRGYVTGSAWADYKKTGRICGIDLPKGLTESEKLPEPIFTPAFKAEQGEHDENIDFDKTVKIVGKENADKLRTLSLSIYDKCEKYASSRGIIIADTKFEFGLIDGEICLIDEVLSPDSSRFWPKDQYKTGQTQNSFDKQYLRDYLNTLDWDKKAPAPDLPDHVVENTLKKYQEAYRIICK
ncbi:MAG: phosphoribosylaminoimidazolesuccinocarboxamide synthase [Candidatus Raymondbacteria bacterium RifOxyA12_full_50_37]|uniref:Phosphoribosylaminoimidazole-succinocarboxamide synthase n=1 Tax=Candidatus Raymondbacteria bacterium RIFOXYD12_FULL_49_13 TaxID=1817890 RepID=A0A1F7F502_UNCRA|nr:MAG: phosphoribosylaminoimidazolesuccinocarboxamide synthase [Candidatus Raymondbacteria bacterium RIFOXYA2_FULL_49_16]OGJ90140.1 MAG: phosphoribosylaminoimidazolesuccinocarboxamide synthase [Candidatus Raymondbacteria bacterium RifOxyA12_full_50_37]OGJ92138.1 MAG: phosphoribosylaminoimidazolesuccinocarboxamide synthase [Candidatus Raymondbacteria bacterium RifOxyB12_full_50_8]OGJ97725.1 MAG: phosphoribosylaminoimidazolesuccinocarboxamide synthase [Candidatus Raymondbacteria bacterium RIFOXYC